jgi:hypothetical protein
LDSPQQQHGAHQKDEEQDPHMGREQIVLGESHAEQRQEGAYAHGDCFESVFHGWYPPGVL